MLDQGSPARPTRGRRERNRLATLDRLYDAAITLFAAQGFEATTVDEIAERADVARATAFNYFPQKISYLEEWGRRRREQVARVLTAQHSRDLPAAEQLRRYLRAMAELNVASRGETVILMAASVRAGNALRGGALDVELGRVIADGQQSGGFRADLDAEQAGLLLGAGYFSAVLRWISAEPAPFDLAAYLDQMLDLLLLGCY